MKKFSYILVVGFIIAAVNVNPQKLIAQKYASKVVCSLIGGMNNKNTNVDLALKEPNNSSKNKKSYDVSLGGGFIILDMGVNIVDSNGPDLVVHESGASYTGASSEPFYVKGSSDMKHGSWVFLGEYSGDKTTIDLKNFGANNIRYIAIFDMTYKPNDNSETPGADIDAVVALNYKK